MPINEKGKNKLEKVTDEGIPICQDCNLVMEQNGKIPKPNSSEEYHFYICRKCSYETKVNGLYLL